MNVLFAKAILYAYSHLEEVCLQIDDLVLKKALSSMGDTSPAIYQYEKIIDFTEQKKVIINLSLVCDKILKRFSDRELDLLDYKYFKKRDKEYYKDFDYLSRTYFRQQIKVALKFASYLEKSGIDDVYFIKKCLPINFFKELLIRVKEKELLAEKNKPKLKPSNIPNAIKKGSPIKTESRNAKIKDESLSIA